MTIYHLFPRYVFSLILVVGIGLGLFFSLGFPLSNKPIPITQKLDAAALALFGALVGGRAAFVLINWQYYQFHLGEISGFWLGGISWIGALVGALLVIFIWSRVQKPSFTDTTDMLLPLFCSTTISVWFGSWFTGSAYGREVNAWWGIPAVDEWGTLTDRWPVPIIGILSTLAFHIMSSRLSTHRKVAFPGVATCLVLSGFSLTMLLLSIVRDDPVAAVASVRLDIWASIGFLVFSSLLASYSFLTRIRPN